MIDVGYMWVLLFEGVLLVLFDLIFVEDGVGLFEVVLVLKLVGVFYVIVDEGYDSVGVLCKVDEVVEVLGVVDKGCVLYDRLVGELVDVEICVKVVGMLKKVMFVLLL